MSKFHISKDGAPRQCRAQTPDSCRATPPDQKEHYETKEEAQKAYEKKSETFTKPLKKGDNGGKITNVASVKRQTNKQIRNTENEIAELEDESRTAWNQRQEEIRTELDRKKEKLNKLEQRRNKLTPKSSPKPKVPEKSITELKRDISIKKDEFREAHEGWEIARNYEEREERVTELKRVEYELEKLESDLKKSRMRQGLNKGKSSNLNNNPVSNSINNDQDFTKTYKKMGNVKNVEFENPGEGVSSVYFKNANNDTIEFSFAGDCCSTSKVVNVDVKPVNSPIKEIKSIGQDEGDGKFNYTGEVVSRNTWQVEYENGEKQTFESYNFSNGYYGNMDAMRTNINLEDD